MPPPGIAEKDQDLTEIAASFPAIGDGEGRKQWGDLEEGMGWGVYEAVTGRK